MDLDRPSSIQATINGIATGSARGLVHVPEIENDATSDAIRKLQIQIFTLADAVADLTAEVERLSRG